MGLADKIYVAGHRELVGSAIVKILRSTGYQTLVLRTKEEFNLRDRAKDESFFIRELPRHGFLAAALVGGIPANSTYTRPRLFTTICSLKAR